MKTFVLHCAVAAVGVVVGFASMTQIESGSTANAIVGGDYNYCRLSQTTSQGGSNQTFGCLPQDAPWSGPSPKCPDKAKKYAADDYTYHEDCDDDTAFNNDKRCDGPDEVVIWNEYECVAGAIAHDMARKLDGDTWSCTKPTYRSRCIECTNGNEVHEEKKNIYDCKDGDPE